MAEVKYLFKKRKIRISFRQVMEAVEDDERCRIYPFDISCVEKLDERLNIHDGAIVATGVIYMDSFDPDTIIITKDKEIEKIGIIKTVW